MVLEECPTTQAVNRYWKEKVLNHFPILESKKEAKFLSLKEYIQVRPQKFYNKNIYKDYFSFLNSFKDNNPKNLKELYNDNVHELNIAIKSLNEINRLNIHDIFEPDDSIKTIRFIENNIHFNYLKLIEAVYHKYILFIAYLNRINRGKSIEGLDIYNCVEELKKTSFRYITTCYDNTIRNGIAHGGITYKDNDTIYKGKRGKSNEIRTKRIVRMFDDMLDICNGLALSFKLFLIINRDFFNKNKLDIPKEFLIQELKAQANAPRWEIVDCLENIIKDNKRQLNIFVNNSLLDFQEVNYYGLRTAVLAEYFARDFDRYFIYLNSKYSLPGFAAYNGQILHKGRLYGDNDINKYKGVLEDNLLFFIPRLKVPNIIRKLINLWIIGRSLMFIYFRTFLKKYRYREAKLFRRNFSIIINDSSIYILTEYRDQIITIIRNDFRKIVRYTSRKSKKELKLFIYRLLPTKYIKVNIYDQDLRKRHLRGSGLIESLVCSIMVNKSSKIKNVDFVGGIPEQYGKYRIVWNKNWKGIKHVC
ncbi:MAG: hypothetical protein ACOC1O_06295 [bacterium]